MMKKKLIHLLMAEEKGKQADNQNLAKALIRPRYRIGDFRAASGSTEKKRKGEERNREGNQNCIQHKFQYKVMATLYYSPSYTTRGRDDVGLGTKITERTESRAGASSLSNLIILHLGKSSSNWIGRWLPRMGSLDPIHYVGVDRYYWAAA